MTDAKTDAIAAITREFTVQTRDSAPDGCAWFTIDTDAMAAALAESREALAASESLRETLTLDLALTKANLAKRKADVREMSDSLEKLREAVRP